MQLLSIRTTTTLRYKILSLLFAILFCVSTHAIEIEHYITAPHTLSAKINPSGNAIVSSHYHNDKQLIKLTDTKTWTTINIFEPESFNDTQSYLKKMEWIDDRYIAAQLAEIRKGIEFLIDTKLSRRLIIIDTHTNEIGEYPIYSVRTSGWLIDTLPNEKNFFLFAKTSSTSKIYKLDVRKFHLDKKRLKKLDRVDGGQFVNSNIYDSIKGIVLKWFIDDTQKVVAAILLDKNGQPKLDEKNNKGELITIKSWPKQEHKKNNNKDDDKPTEKLLFPYIKASGEQTYYCLDLNEDKEKKIYKVDYKNNTELLVYETSSYKIKDILLDEKREIFAVQVEKEGRVDFEYINQEHHSNSSDSTKNNNIIDITLSYTKDQSHAVAYTESFQTPGYFYYTDKNGKELKVIGKRYDKLASKLKVELIEGYIDVEGQNIHWLLLKPSTKDKYPLVVMPHGGPLGIHDTPYFNANSQLLVDSGYAVLRINYRGSSGYSEEFEEAGKKQWGKLILEDIYQATTKVATLPSIDQSRMCILGFSYGGYAAMQLSIQYPSLFKCAASISGVSDLNLFLSSDHPTKAQTNWLREYVGDTRTQYDELKVYSPVYHVNKLAIPLFLAHGDDDTIVDAENSYRMKYMLDKLGKTYEWYIDPDADHQFGEDDQKVKLYKAIMSFLQKHL